MKQINKKNFLVNALLFLFFSNFDVFAKEDLVADLSEDTIEITTTFSGAEILLFGAYNGEKGDDIIVIVSGPKGKIKVQNKEKKFGL